MSCEEMTSQEIDARMREIELKYESPEACPKEILDEYDALVKEMHVRSFVNNLVNKMEEIFGPIQEG